MCEWQWGQGDQAESYCNSPQLGGGQRLRKHTTETNSREIQEAELARADNGLDEVVRDEEGRKVLG